MTVRELVNEFLTAKKSLLENGEITYRTFEEAHRTGELLCSTFGKARLVGDLGADDFDKLAPHDGKELGASPTWQ